jgi:hypothetical protein
VVALSTGLLGALVAEVPGELLAEVVVLLFQPDDFCAEGVGDLAEGVGAGPVWAAQRDWMVAGSPGSRDELSDAWFSV